MEEIDSRRDFQLYMRFSVMIYFLLVMSARCPGGRNTLLPAVYQLHRPEPHISPVWLYEIFSDVSPVEEIECQRFS